MNQLFQTNSSIACGVTDFRRRKINVCIAICCILMLGGCGLISRRYAGPSPDGRAVGMPNPMVIPYSDPDFVWLQLVDMMDDYFEIASEQQVSEIDGIMMGGEITTRPLRGATYPEFLRRDAANHYERMLGTLQSIRRSATMRVLPVASGLQIELQVLKQLEDVSQPEYSTVTSAVRRHDDTLITPPEKFDPDYGPATLGWISLGRDTALEQEMLRNLHARLFEASLVPPQGYQQVR